MCARFNKDWLPYVLGGLFQLVNPSSWLVDDEASLQQVLERATALLDIFGQAGDCPPMELRFTDGCVLQYSLDGGTTWLDVSGWTANFSVCNPPQTELAFTSDCLLTESFDGGETFEAVPGWAANFADCVVKNAPIVGLPPNPGDQSPDQFACSIAAYLADQVILLGMQKAVNAIQDDLTLLVFGGEVLTIIPEFVLVAAAYDAFAGIYGAIAEGTLAHYEAAIVDEVLWQAVTCAIYNAIRSTGYVTPGNFGAILTGIDAISYTYSDVISAIHGYVGTLGATGLAQLSQRAGLLVGSSCDCGSGPWCVNWGAAGEPISLNWTCLADDHTNCGHASGNLWNSDPGFEGNFTWIKVVLPHDRTIHRARVDHSGGGFTAFAWRFYDAADTLLFSTSSQNWDGGVSSIDGVHKIALICGSGSAFTLTNIEIAGPAQGTPFDFMNCTP